MPLCTDGTFSKERKMSGFSDIIGHEKIIEHLRKASKSGKISHAYIFNGEDGSGKMMLAESFAMTLLCEQSDTDPCMECHSCVQARGHNNPDIKYVTHEKADLISVSEIRSQLVDDVSIRPYSSKYKVYIVDDAQKMNIQAQNAILKTIEEPPEYVVILLLTNNAQGFLPTITSRCVTLNLYPVSSQLLEEYLIKQYRMPDYQAKICVSFSQGNVGRAIDLAVSSEFDELKNEVLQVLKNIIHMQEFELLDAVKRAKIYKLQINDYFDLMAVWYRDVLLYKATQDVNHIIYKDEIYAIKDLASKVSYEGLNEILEYLKKAKKRVSANVNLDLVVELLLWEIKERIK